MESMSGAPYLLKEARFGFRMGEAKALDAMVTDGLTNPSPASTWARRPTRWARSSRSPAPTWTGLALRSHELAVQATDEGRLPEEIVPAAISSRKGDTTVEIDEAPRRESSLEALEATRGIQQGGAHTAGNAPGVNDGAGAMVLARTSGAGANGRTPPRDDRGPGGCGRRLSLPGLHFANAARKALDKAGLSVTTSTCSR